MFYFARLMFALLLLSGSLWAFSSNTYLSWVKPSHVHSVWTGDASNKYDRQESIVHRFNGTYYSANANRKYAGKLGVLIKEYTQPGGLPGFNYMHIYDRSSNGEIRVNKGVKGYSYPAGYWDNLFEYGDGTDDIGSFKLWFLTLPYLGQDDRVIRIDSCFVYMGNELCKTAKVVINGI